MATGTENAPVLTDYKGKFGSLNDLWSAYSEGGEYGWWAFVTSMGTFAWWNNTTSEWEPLNIYLFETNTVSSLTDGDAMIWDSEKKLFTKTNLALWGTEQY